MSDVYLLDTTVASPAINDKHRNHALVRAWLDAKGRPRNNHVLISSITIGEVEYGLQFGSLDDATRREFRDGLREFGISPVTKHVAETYGELRHWIIQKYGPTDLRKIKGKQIEDLLPDKSYRFGENDLWIASTAVVQDLVYVTFDTKQKYIFEAADSLYSYTRYLEGVAALRTSP